MMMSPAPYPGLDMDDAERLAALSGSKPPIPFEEAYAMLDNGSPREVAERAYKDFQENP